MFLKIIIFVVSLSYVYSYENAIYDISDLNSDTHLDTIYLKSKNGNLGLDKINWGSSSYTTHFQYPEMFYQRDFFWNIDINKDGIKDLVVLSSGKIDTVDYKDTAYLKIVYGQSGFETIDTIKIEEIDSLQFTPYVASTIYPDLGISQGKIQSLSEFPVFELYFNNLDVTDSTVSMKQIFEEEPMLIARFNIYPNPAYYYTNIEMIDIQPGNYSIEIRKLSSEVINKFSITTQTKSNITKYLDLKDYATGTYLVQIYSENRLLLSYKLIVIK